MKSQIEVTKDFVVNTPLPSHAGTYTVISHKFVIDNTKQMLANSGFIIINELYRANNSGEVAQGIYHIKPLSGHDDNEIGMMFAWTNSYDKSIRFQCAIGAHVFACSNGMVCGELNYARKHTGTADQEIKMQISNQIKNAQKAFDRIKDDRDNLRNTPLTFKEQAQLLGRMYFNEDLIGSRQMSCVKDEMEKPSYDYKCDQENAWAFYNHVTHSYKSVHPRSWLSDTKNFHDFMVANVLNGMGITPMDSVNTNNIIEDEFTEDELASQLYGVDNNNEVVHVYSDKFDDSSYHGDVDNIDGVDEVINSYDQPYTVDDSFDDFDFEI
jgi:hypothetical protein